jgi:hypothetical protein
VSDTGDVESTRRAAEALEELVRLEAEQQVLAVRGEGFKTLWSTHAARR